MYRIAIVQFPGSNCEAESIRAVRSAGMEPEEFLWNHDCRKLETYDGYFIVGGFSYEDRSRAGIIAALDPVMRVIVHEAEKGKPVLGVCNGAQILVETGLVPGLKDNALGMALAVNKGMKDGEVLAAGFYNGWVRVALDAPPGRSAFTRHLTSWQTLRLPVAHGEGRFVMTESLLTEIKTNQQTAFRYCDAGGNFAEEFPINPNGAMYNLAAVINRSGNVMAMMPHPERAPAGQPIFTSMREYINQKALQAPAGGRVTNYESLKHALPKNEARTYRKPHNSFALITDLIITDNEAITVQNTLDAIGIHAEIEKFTHWEITTSLNHENNKTLKQIIDSDELLNSNKEIIYDTIPCRCPQCAYLLVRYRDDVFGAAKKQSLISRFGLTDLRDIKRGTIWKISIQRGNIETVVDNILRTHILFNPYSQECFRYATS